MHPDIESLIKELIALGEDREELVFWKTIYKDLRLK